jgi:SAM-dependent methyltransferase
MALGIDYHCLGVEQKGIRMGSGGCDANAAQWEFWNSDSGVQWVTHQSRFDAAMAPCLDLLMAEARPVAGERVLDIGCGTGATSLGAARRVGAGGRVVGADISSVLLENARLRARAEGVFNVDFLECDAQTHAFAPQTYDLAISRFGMMFFADPAAAFANIRAAIRPGGRVVFVAWAAAEQNPWFDLPRAVARQRLGEAPAGDPSAPGPFAFQDLARVGALMRVAGWRDIQADSVRSLLTPSGTLAETAAFVTRAGPAVRIIQAHAASREVATEIEAEVAEALAAFGTPTGVRIPALFNVFSARAA